MCGCMCVAWFRQSDMHGRRHTGIQSHTHDSRTRTYTNMCTHAPTRHTSLSRRLPPFPDRGPHHSPTHTHTHTHIYLHTLTHIHTHTQPGACHLLGVLDIFGFECYTKGDSNSLEQLCINFANECLQHQFNTHTFETEARVLDREGLTLDPPRYVDNLPIVQLIGRWMCLGVSGHVCMCMCVCVCVYVYTCM